MTNPPTNPPTTQHGPRLPVLETGDDAAVCRLRTMIIIATVAAVVGTAMIMVLGGRPIPAWKWILLAGVAVPAVRATSVPILFALSTQLLLYILSWPTLGPLTGVGVLCLHLSAHVWFLGSTVRPSAWVHRSALRAIVVRFAWIQVLAQVGVVLAIVTSGLPANQLVGSLGVLTMLGLVVALTILARSSSADARGPG